MQELVSFDGGVRLQCAVARPDRYRSLISSDLHGPRISRGAGLSYGAASFGSGIVSIRHAQFNRVLGFDPQAGTVTVEAGISLGELFDFLAPKGFFLAIQPGHPSISVGGCVAADAHGKNQFKDGNFSEQVERLTLFHPRHGILALSRQSEPDLFELTCGGYGLTGSILEVTLRTKLLPGRVTRLETTAIDGLSGLPALLRNAAVQSDAVYSWHDLSVSAGQFGRGVLVRASFVKNDGQPERERSGAGTQRLSRGRLTASRRGRWVPPLLNSFTVPRLNAFLFRLQNKRAHRSAALHESLFPLAGAASRYFDLYGSRGFHEYQVILPGADFAAFAAELERQIRTSRVPVSLASAKLFGGKQNFLRFNGHGVCFAIDIPRTPTSSRLLSLLDQMAIDCGGIPNIIKDSRLPKSVAERVFPQMERFCGELRDFDPQRLYRSDLSERLGL